MSDANEGWRKKREKDKVRECFNNTLRKIRIRNSWRWPNVRLLILSNRSVVLPKYGDKVTRRIHFYLKLDGFFQTCDA